MDIHTSHHENSVLGLVLVIISLLSSSISILALKDIHELVSISAGVVAIFSGSFAIRYYYNATKKIKNK